MNSGIPQCYAMGDKNTIITGIIGSGRLDRALSDAHPDLSRARMQALIGGGALMVGGAVITDMSSKKLAGLPYALTLPPVKADHAVAQDIAIPIVYEDEYLVIVNKPAGMVVHPSAGHPDGSLVNALLHHCRGSLSGIGGIERPGIVHRIDKDTSGLLVVAKTDKTHEGLAKLFATHDIERKYLAIVSGVPAPPAGVIRTQIGRSSTNRLKMAVLVDDTVEHAADNAGGGRGGTGSRNPDDGTAKIRGKRAITHYRVEEAFKANALVGCTLETGRTHQVRVHMAHIGHALIGDPVYANRQKAYKIGPEQVIFKRQALHAASLGFIHPITGEKLYFACNIPDDMQELLRQLRV